MILHHKASDLYFHLSLGPSEALRRLAARFPGGSAKPEVERRRRAVEDEQDSDEIVTNVVYDIIHEIEAQK